LFGLSGQQYGLRVGSRDTQKGCPWIAKASADPSSTGFFASVVMQNYFGAVLMFRDGHRSEVQNYGIVGLTLWVFTERHAKKYPVGDLICRAPSQQ
jgi:hypothetical protein